MQEGTIYMEATKTGKEMEMHAHGWEKTFNQEGTGNGAGD